MKRIVWFVLAIGLVLMALFLPRTVRVVWVEAYAQVRFTIRLQDKDGGPITHAGVDVIDDKGKRSYVFPVSDYSRGRRIESDNTGRIVLHHVCGGTEYEGMATTTPWGCVTKTSRPRFFVYFVKDGRIVGTIDFDKLYAAFEDAKRLDKMRFEKVQWQWPADYENDIDPKYHRLRFPEGMLEFASVDVTVEVDQRDAKPGK